MTIDPPQPKAMSANSPIREPGVMKRAPEGGFANWVSAICLMSLLGRRMFADVPSGEPACRQSPWVYGVSIGRAKERPQRRLPAESPRLPGAPARLNAAQSARWTPQRRLPDARSVTAASGRRRDPRGFPERASDAPRRPRSGARRLRGKGVCRLARRNSRGALRGGR